MATPEQQKAPLQAARSEHVTKATSVEAAIDAANTSPHASLLPLSIECWGNADCPDAVLYGIKGAHTPGDLFRSVAAVDPDLVRMLVEAQKDKRPCFSPEFIRELEEEEEEERRLEDLEEHPWKKTLLPYCKELALLPIGGNKIPVDLKTGRNLKGWQVLSYGIEELVQPNSWLKGLGYRPGPESGHIACFDIDGATALAWLLERDARPEDAGWRILRTKDRMKVPFRIPESLRDQLPLGKLVLQIKPKGPNGEPAEQIEFFYGSGQCVIAGLHPSGGVYRSEGNPETVTEPNEAWTQVLLELIAKSKKAEPAHGEVPEERWQSGPGSPCPVCGRDTTSACTVWLCDNGDGTTRRGVNCLHGSTFSPPRTMNLGCSVRELPLDKGDEVQINGVTWAFVREGENSLGKFSVFLEHRSIESKGEGGSSCEEHGPAKLVEMHFSVLGWADGDRDGIYYRANATGQIAVTKCRTRTDLLRMAPLEHWIEGYGKQPEEQNEPRQAPPDWDAAISAVIAEADRAGVFDLGSLRGHGVWLDVGRVVWHLGDRIEVDGAICSLEAAGGKFHYARLHPLGVDPTVAPLQNTEGEAVFGVIRQMGWASPVDSLHLAGWIVLANVGGALSKRPGLQLTSSSGSGKSDCVSRVIEPLLAGLAIYSSTSSEAGVRQSLKSASLPAVIDESEQENPKKREAQLRLVRLSYDGVPQLMGTPSGEARSFAMRSSICLVGINATIPNVADRNRIVVISRQQIPDEAWAGVSRLRDELITLEIGERLLRRTVSNLKTLLANIATFRRVVAKRYGGRTGNTYGSLLAGAHHLTSLELLDEDQARQWIDAKQWALSEEDRAESAAKSEAEQCLEHLLKHEVPFANGVAEDGSKISDASGKTSIREVIQYLSLDDGNVARGCAEDFHKEGQKTLGRYGLKLDQERGLLVHTGGKGKLPDVYAGTRWANGAYKDRLLDLPGVERVPSPPRFPVIGTNAAIALPMSLICE
jgi:hypothetical protein